MFALFNLNFVSIERTLLTFRRDCWACHRPKNIRIHLAVSGVRFHLLRFNSSGNFCDALRGQTTDVLVGRERSHLVLPQ
jgi:hypothetical protein